MNFITKITNCIDNFTKWTGYLFSTISLVTLGVIVLEVFMRRVLNSSQIWSQDVIIISFGIYIALISAFGLLSKSFVAVDVVFDKFPPIVQHILSLVTYGVFFYPFVFMLLPEMYGFFMNAYTNGELGYSVWQHPTWPLKLSLFVGFSLLALQGTSEILKHVNFVISYFTNKNSSNEVE